MSFSSAAAVAPTSGDSTQLAESIEEELWFGDSDPKRSANEASNSLAAAAGRASQLKPFPAVAGELLGLLSQPDVQIRELSATAEKDAALAVTLVRVANSALYRSSRPLTSLEDVIARLGLRTTREIVACVATLAMFDDATGIGTQIRDHCAGTASIARMLADQYGRKYTQDLFLAALLHDVGKLFELAVGVVGYETFDPFAFDDPDRIHVLERSRVGYDHAVLGAHVVRSWNISRDVARLVAWHHQPTRAYEIGGSIAIQTALLRLANILEHKIAVDPEYDGVFLEDLEDSAEINYLGFSVDLLRGLWPKLVEVHRELMVR